MFNKERIRKLSAHFGAVFVQLKDRFAHLWILWTSYQGVCTLKFCPKSCHI